MRIDVVTIFPAYLAPLELSLPGRARASGVLDLRVHDLRAWTHDRHRTVDDAPYGGGAGMVMRPEPWGEALDELAGPQTILVVPTPSGRPFRQDLAEELATREHLLVACGRYEGIDQRVMTHAAGRMRVLEVSLGDYVLNGGEVAALAIVEAVARLLPGFMGNEASLDEESHGADRLLEYPVYTRPESWRGLEVPEVLRSGDHARVAAWRRDEARRRTAERRPDLLAPSRLAAAEIRPAVPADAGELLTLHRAAGCAGLGDGGAGMRSETLADAVDQLARWTTLVARAGDRLVGTVRARSDGTTWVIERLAVAPDVEDEALERALLQGVEDLAPPEAAAYALLLAPGAEAARRAKRLGYSLRAADAQPGPAQPGPAQPAEASPGALLLTKPRRSR